MTLMGIILLLMIVCVGALGGGIGFVLMDVLIILMIIGFIKKK